ncbi:hypothetical protein PUR28_05150 [Streptomyces sp. BE308]|uniref:HAAS signaling domain-containing protein n=1 Tax=unclassified Streptomyces TaxID=2593676 RepID=UPI002E791737|nr:hypothetical protein [Streptomyces sp. BE308]MEE1790171.1 hypothetical protein [Streptomyces sp. BE308]
MKTRDNALVRAYLDAVERESAALPAARREELIADLDGHIAVAVADAGATDDTVVQRVLDQLGDPRTVARSALAEEAPDGGDGKRRDWSIVTLALLLLSIPLGVAVSYLGITAAVIGIFLLWTTDHWTGRDRIIGTLIPVSTPVTMIFGEIVAGLILTERDGLWDLAIVIVIALILPIVGAVHLARNARR